MHVAGGPKTASDGNAIFKAARTANRPSRRGPPVAPSFDRLVADEPPGRQLTEVHSNRRYGLAGIASYWRRRAIRDVRSALSEKESKLPTALL
jgi:hypothetical protein